MSILAFKLFVRGFLVIFIHLRAIEVQLEMTHAVTTIDPEIETFQEYLHQ